VRDAQDSNWQFPTNAQFNSVKLSAKVSTVMDPPEWLKQKERGGMLPLRFMSWLSLTLGRRLSRYVVYLIALYFVLAVPATRKASRDYLSRCLGRPPTFIDLYRHILAFSTTIHDRIYLLNDRHELFDIQILGAESLHELHAENIGIFLFGAHLGSFEVLRSIARENLPLKVCVAMFPENARQVNSVFAAINPKAIHDIIVLGQLDSMLTIYKKLQEGAMVGILADRASGPDQYISVPFLGSVANFPTGPFRMAAMLKHPIFFMAGLYRGGNRYDVHFELLADFSEQTSIERDALVRDIIIKYADALERHCKSAPFNWFNFYNFWKPELHGKD
jgi:predicted LPLAT superfamily acyltransferase